MKFKLTLAGFLYRKRLLQIIMRTFIFLLCTTVFGFTSESTFSQEKIIIDADKKVSIDEVFKIIKDQTKYRFFYPEDMFSEAPKVQLKAGEIALKMLLKQSVALSNVHFKLSKNNTIVLMKNDTPQQIAKVIIQGVEISGIVSDETGGPLMGATVIEKGTSNGAITDIDGGFTLTVNEDAVLEISYLGYKTIVVSVTSDKAINVKMELDSSKLDEVILVGYGEQKKETLSGSVVNISGDVIKRSPAANVTNSLQGRLPGVSAVSLTGEPGRDDARILIRGQSTFGDNNPLVVIDGVIRPIEGLGRIDSQDIESITVLKDASAAIYGARAANGVILVQTKRGTISDKPEFSFTFNSGISKPTRVLDVLDAVTYAQVRNEAATRGGGTNVIYSDEDIQKYRDGSSPLTHANTDWVKEVLKSSSYQNKMHLSVSGGSKKIKYFVSLGSQTQDGHFKNNPTGYSQFNLRSNLDAEITDNFKFSLNLAGRLEERTYPSTGTWVNFVNILSAEPTIPARYPNGLIAAGRFTENPLLRDQVGELTQKSTPVQTTLSVVYDTPFIDGLSLSASYSYDFTNQFNKTFETPYKYWEYNETIGDYDHLQSNVISSPSVRDRYIRNISQTYNFRINYAKKFGNHNMALMVGAERNQIEGSYAEAYRRNFPTTSLPDINFGSSDPTAQSTAGGSSLTKRDNYFGRANYNYKEKYLAEFLFRYDGSPVFPEDKRYGFFPGISVGWVVSKENFLKESNTLDFLKIRASYGELGNDNIKESYAYLSAFTIGTAYTFGGNDALGLYPGVLPNPNYTWEVLETTNFGLDADFWNKKLSVELDVFQQNRKNILAERQVSISDTYGFAGLPPENIGEVENHGFELSLSHFNSINDFDYRIRGNVSYAKNKYVFFDEVPLAEEYQNKTGRPIGAELIWPTAGIYGSQEEIDNSVHLDNAQPGDVIFVDKNGDGFINGDDQYRTDLSTSPQLIYGLDMSFNYKKFDVSLFFQGAGKSLFFPGITGLGGNTNSAVFRAEDRWTPSNLDATMPAAGGNFPQLSDQNAWNAAFVRLKNVEIGYEFPKEILEKIGFNSLRLYANGFNVFTISKIDFLDPEGRGDGSDADSTRNDANYYPQLKVFNVGFNISF